MYPQGILCLGSVRYSEFLEMFHKHLQTDVIGEHRSSSRILTPSKHIVMGLRRVYFGQQETSLEKHKKNNH